MVCIYHQWKLLHMDENNTYLQTKQLERLRLILSVSKSLRDNGAETMLIGDINIDIWPPNDPAQRKDIKHLYAEYKSVMNELGMS